MPLNLLEFYIILECLELDNTKAIWLEDESHSIGSNWIPQEFFNLMRKAPVLKMELPKSERIKRLVNEYAGFDVKYLEECVLKIGKRLGGQHVKAALESLQKGQLDTVADITLTYYDKSYNFGLNQRTNNTVYPIALEADNPEKNAEILIEFAQKNI